MPSSSLRLATGRVIWCVDVAGPLHPFDDGTTELVQAHMDKFEKVFLKAGAYVDAMIKAVRPKTR